MSNNVQKPPGLMKGVSFIGDMIDNLGIGQRDFIGGNKSHSVLTREGLTIVVIKGSVADQVVDVIVNSVGGSFDLRQGALSKAILEKAGPKIQEELKSLRPKVTTYGTVYTTQGYYLSATHVFHGVLKQWNKGKDDAEEILRCFIRNSLMEASRRKLKTISIPAVGTGVLQFPSDLVVDCLFSEVDKFSETEPNTTLNEIRFVVYDKDQTTFNAFEAWLNEIKPNEDANQASAMTEYDNISGGSSEDDDDDDDDDEEEELDMSTHLRDMKMAAEESKATFRQIGSAFPPTWKPEPSGKQYGTTVLDSSDAEFKAVFKRIMETKGGASIRNVLKIERIENRTLYQLYLVHKSDMEKRNGNGIVNERSLWHGTVKESITNICSGGFNRSYCGKNAVAYGQGVYFAQDFSYSAQNQYSKPDNTGAKYIFMCKVLTGTFTTGNSTMIEPDMKTGTDFRHDATVNNESNPTIFVVFKDAQAYPEYLVAFN